MDTFEVPNRHRGHGLPLQSPTPCVSNAVCCRAAARVTVLGGASQAQIDAQRAINNWEDVSKSIKAYIKLVGSGSGPAEPRQQLSTAHNTPALATAYAATVQAEVAFRKKRSFDDARKYIGRALDACPTYPVRSRGNGAGDATRNAFENQHSA